MFNFTERPPDVLCVFGRGIQKRTNGQEEIWEPTEHVEQLTPEGQHPGTFLGDPDPNSDDPSVRVGGGKMNTIAAAFLFKGWREHGSRPGIVVFAAGRPNYLALEPPELSEGAILREWFMGRTESKDAEIILQDQNKTTLDDLEKTLWLAKQRTLSSVAVVTVLPHIARCMEFLKQVRKTFPQLTPIEATFISSEIVMAYGYPKSAQRILETMNSKAYERTMFWERKGIADFRAGTYASVQDTAPSAR